MSCNILVTGASGFVGRRLCRSLIDRGHNVTAAIRTPAAARRLPPGVSVVVGEIGPAAPFGPEAFDNVDVVVHLAARVHREPDPAPDPAAEFQKVNRAGTEALARAAAGRVRRFVYVSSVHAVRLLADEILDEHSLCRPCTPYGKSKLEAEEALSRIAAQTGLETVIVRPPPVYGPESPGNLSRLFRLVRSGWPVPLGSVSNRRSLIYVENLVDALIAAATHPAASGHTFMISDGEDVSIPQLVHTVAAALGQKAIVFPAPVGLLRIAGSALRKSSEIERLLGSLTVDSDKFRRLLDWRAPRTMTEGIAATVQWMRNAA